MADLTEHDPSTPGHDDPAASAAAALDSSRSNRKRPAANDDDDDDDDKPGRERRKIDIKFINDKSRRHITFSKRKAGIMKKVCHVVCLIDLTRHRHHRRRAWNHQQHCDNLLMHLSKQAYELSVLTGTQVLLLVVSETGLVYTFTTPKLQPLVTKPDGKNLIQVCQIRPHPKHNSQY